jgi:hypothetical protein
MSTYEGYILYRPDTDEFLHYYHRRKDFMSVGWSNSVDDSLVFDSPLDAAPVGGNISEVIEQTIEMWELVEVIDSLEARFFSQYQPRRLRQENEKSSKN